MRLDRIESTDPVLIDVIDCFEQPELNDTSFSGKTVDVSEYGMQLAATMKIPVATRLAIRLDLQSTLYRLEGVVRWSRRNGEYLIGLQLDEDSADLVAWTRRFQLDF